MNKISIFLITILLISGVSNAKKNESDKLFKKSYIKKAMTTALEWQLINPKHELYDWTNGAFYAGVFAAYETTKSKKIYEAIYQMGEKNQWKAGPRLQHADDHAICQTYIDMYRISGDKKMIDPFIKTMDEFIATPYKTADIRKCT